MKKIIFLLIFFWFIPNSSFAENKSDTANILKTYKTNNANLIAIRDAQIYLYLLDSIRSNRLDTAVEFIEHQLDCIVVGSDMRKNCFNNHKPLLINIMKKLKKYRELYPRELKIKVDAQDASILLDKSDYSLTEKAQELLLTY